MNDDLVEQAEKKLDMFIFPANLSNMGRLGWWLYVGQNVRLKAGSLRELLEKIVDAEW
jgi:hypothetical protein